MGQAVRIRYNIVNHLYLHISTTYEIIVNNTLIGMFMID